MNLAMDNCYAYDTYVRLRSGLDCQNKASHARAAYTVYGCILLDEHLFAYVFGHIPSCNVCI